MAKQREKCQPCSFEKILNTTKVYSIFFSIRLSILNSTCYTRVDGGMEVRHFTPARVQVQVQVQ